jgi:hypothetical protein
MLNERKTPYGTNDHHREPSRGRRREEVVSDWRKAILQQSNKCLTNNTIECSLC